MTVKKMDAHEPSVLVLGYSRRLEGGVSKVTGLLIDNMPELRLYPVLFSYGSRIKSAWQTMFSFLLYISKLLFDFRKYKVIHVLVCSSGDAIRALPFITIAKIFGKKVCIQFHTSTDAIITGLKNSFVRSVVVNIWNRVDMLCFLSDRLMVAYKKSYPGDVAMVVIPNLLDMRWLKAEPLSYSERNRDIVFLGRWSREKGVDDLIAVMEALDLDVSCEFYSDSPADIVKKGCVFCNWVDEEMVFDIIRSAKILVLPSYAEAYPTVLLEACACGTPFIATNIGGIPDIAEQSNAGLLMEPGDRVGLSDAIKRLLTDEKYWMECSRNGRSWISSVNNDDIVSLWRANYRKLAE